MAKSRGKTIRRKNTRPPQGPVIVVGLPEIQLGSWRPADDAKPEQVHLIFSPPQMPPLVIRFKSPDTLGFLIEEMARYRRDVWPGAEPLNLSDPGPLEEGNL